MLDSIIGERLPSLPIPSPVHVRDLIWYDGPLSSEYVDATGRHYLFHWCDREMGYRPEIQPKHRIVIQDRWMVLRMLSVDIDRLAVSEASDNSEKDLMLWAEALPGWCLDDFVYFLDFGVGDEWERPGVVMKVAVGEIPLGYLPRGGAKETVTTVVGGAS